MNRPLLLSLMLAGMALQLGESEAQTTSAKEALLIANGNYSRLGKLESPLSDAQTLAKTLQNIGFRVTLVQNASREGMIDALQAFQERLKSSHSIAFFHYGGHGMQLDGQNYLIPADADIPDENKLKTRAVDMAEVMSSLEGSGAEASIVVFDACRNNPLPKVSSRSMTRGLAVVQSKPPNSIIVYSADAGREAVDGVFTPTLAQQLGRPGESIQKILLDVRKQVQQLTTNSQIPSDYSQLTEEIVLNPGGSIPAGSLQTITSMPPPAATPIPTQTLVFEPVRQAQPPPASAPTRDPNQIPGLDRFFQEWVNSWCSNDPDVQAAPFADVVDYCYWNHQTQRDRISKGAENFIKNFPTRNYFNLRIHSVMPHGPDDVTINYSVGYRYSGNRTASGSTNVTIDVHRFGELWRITRFTEKVTKG